MKVFLTQHRLKAICILQSSFAFKKMEKLSIYNRISAYLRNP